MISRVQGKTLQQLGSLEAHPKLSAVERGLIRWAVIDPEDKVLDANIGTGMLAEYLRRNLQCEVCGVSGSIEDIKRARVRLQNADIVYGGGGDIPWRENAFDAVFYQLPSASAEAVEGSLAEIKRVLKEGGQLLLGVDGYFSALFAPQDEEAQPLHKKRLMRILRDAGFEHIAWQRVRLCSGVMIAWKRRSASAELSD
ncbi:MAG: class I SAM-dependent methyltransferase [Clostridia bacterium]